MKTPRFIVFVGVMMFMFGLLQRLAEERTCRLGGDSDGFFGYGDKIINSLSIRCVRD